MGSRLGVSDHSCSKSLSKESLPTVISPCITRFSNNFAKGSELERVTMLMDVIECFAMDSQGRRPGWLGGILQTKQTILFPYDVP